MVCSRTRRLESDAPFSVVQIPLSTHHHLENRFARRQFRLLHTRDRRSSGTFQQKQGPYATEQWMLGGGNESNNNTKQCEYRSKQASWTLQGVFEDKLPWFTEMRRFRVYGRPGSIPSIVDLTELNSSFSTHIEVPHCDAGFPIMILSDTPVMPSFFPNAAASNRWSVVFSNEASMSTLSFILATPNRVIPKTSPWRNRRGESKVSA